MSSPDDPIYSCALDGPAPRFHSLWYTFVADETAAFISVTRADSDVEALVGVYDGTCSSLTELSCGRSDLLRYGPGIRSVPMRVTPAARYSGPAAAGVLALCATGYPNPPNNHGSTLPAKGSRFEMNPIYCCDEFADEPVNLIAFRPTRRWSPIDLIWALVDLPLLGLGACYACARA